MCEPDKLVSEHHQASRHPPDCGWTPVRYVITLCVCPSSLIMAEHLYGTSSRDVCVLTHCMCPHSLIMAGHLYGTLSRDVCVLTH